MKKLFLSAFALGLMLSLGTAWSRTDSSGAFLGLETELLPELKGPQNFTPESLHEQKDWNVSPKEVEVDLPRPIKGQGHSLIAWGEQDPNEWLDIHRWLL